MLVWQIGEQKNDLIYKDETLLIDHFTVGCLVTWPMNESETGIHLFLNRDFTAFQRWTYLCPRPLLKMTKD